MTIAPWDVAIIDPPWPKRKGGQRRVRPHQGRALAYPTLSLSAIFTLLDQQIFFSHGVNFLFYPPQALFRPSGDETLLPEAISASISMI